MSYIRGSILVVLGLVSFSVHGALSYSSGVLTVNQAVPDGVGANLPGSTLSVNHSVSYFGSGYTISDVNVSINVSGGFNGDIFARLDYAPASAGGGGTGFAILLNRMGRTGSGSRGSSGAGMAITLDDDFPAATDIHLFGSGVPTGTYLPDGRNVDPTVSYSGTTRTPNSLSSGFDTLAADGTWTLTFADYWGGAQPTINSWSLNIEAVPEPITTSLIIVGGIFGCFQFVRYLRARKSVLA